MPETNFFWDPLSDNILQERDETGAVTAEYTTEPGLYGNLISQNRLGVESQYHFDALGSTLALTDDQQVTDTYAYAAFGEVTEHTGSTVNPFQYVGQKAYYRDEVVGECLVRRRSYAPRLGRWVTKDPIIDRWPYCSTEIVRESTSVDPSMKKSNDVQKECGVFGFYPYCDNNPLQFRDPSGLAPDDKGPTVCIRQRVDATKDKSGKYTCPMADQTLVFDPYYVREEGKAVLKMRVWCIKCGGEPNPCAKDEECARKVFEDKDKKTGLPFQETVCVCCKKGK